MAIFGYIIGSCCKRGGCYCCSTIVYNEAKTAVLKLSVIKQIGLATVGVLGVIIPGAIAGGVVVGVLAAAGVPLTTKGYDPKKWWWWVVFQLVN